MPRDPGLEALLTDDLADLPGLAQKAMFGGLAWLLDGKLLCAASTRGMLVRLGKENDAWALAVSGITTTEMRGRKMNGWVSITPDVSAQDDLRRRLLREAVRFVRSLPR